MGKKRKQRLCRICKKRPVWIGGDVKNPGPVCKKCYHAHVWPERMRRQGRIVQGAPTPEQKKKKVVPLKEPTLEVRPLRDKRWKLARARFELTLEEVAMAQATKFTPIRMDHVATGTRRNGKEKLPRDATAEQIAMAKRVIRERYAIYLRCHQERAGMAKLSVMVPPALKAHVVAECARAGLMLDEVIEALLKERFPMNAPEPESPHEKKNPPTVRAKRVA